MAVLTGTDEAAEGRDTRERILDVALDLFTEQGFEKTSLRQIAERMGFSKAALYYHFASKDDILMALHLRVHELGADAMAQLEGHPPDASADQQTEHWYHLLDAMIGNMLGNRRLFEFHERNRAALERLHSERHEQDHGDMEARFRQVLSDARLPVEQRVRLASAVGVAFGNLFLVGEAFVGVPSEELARVLRRVLRDVLAVGGGDADGSASEVTATT